MFYSVLLPWCLAEHGQTPVVFKVTVRASISYLRGAEGAARAESETPPEAEPRTASAPKPRDLAGKATAARGQTVTQPLPAPLQAQVPGYPTQTPAGVPSGAEPRGRGPRAPWRARGPRERSVRRPAAVLLPPSRGRREPTSRPSRAPSLGRGDITAFPAPGSSRRGACSRSERRAGPGGGGEEVAEPPARRPVRAEAGPAAARVTAPGTVAADSGEDG